MTLRALVLPILLVFVAPTARVRSQKPDVAGFFSNMYASSRTGDIGGATIFISWAKVHNGLEERYYAFVQTAEGVPSEPVLAMTIRASRNPHPLLKLPVRASAVILPLKGLISLYCPSANAMVMLSPVTETGASTGSEGTPSAVWTNA